MQKLKTAKKGLPFRCKEKNREKDLIFTKRGPWPQTLPQYLRTKQGEMSEAIQSDELGQKRVYFYKLMHRETEIGIQMELKHAHLEKKWIFCPSTAR